MRCAHRVRLRVVALLAVLSLAASNGVAFGQTASDPVASAVKRQDWAAVRTRVERLDETDTDAAVNRPLGDGATALHWAAYWDHVETARLLIEVGARVNPENDLGVTPLWLASQNGSVAMVETLLEAGADPNRGLPSGETPLMTSVRTGNVDVVAALVAHGAQVDAREASHGQTVLMWAVAQQHPAVVRVLLAGGARTDTRSHVYPQVVSSSGNADPSGVFEVTQGGYTPLLFAARQGDLASARLLVAAGAAVNDAAPSGTSPLVVAAHSGHGVLAAFFLESGADPNDDAAGYAPLHAAVLRGDLELVTTLLAHGANPDVRLWKGTPARRVSADWRLAHNTIGATPFWLAARFREPAIMRVLAESGADPLVPKNETTSLMAALEGGTTRGRFGVPRLPPDEEARLTVEAVRVALDRGVDVNDTNQNGNTALHIATSRRLDAAIRLLAQRGAALDLRNNQGETPLDVAMSAPLAPSGNRPTATLLRELGAEDDGAHP